MERYPVHTHSNQQGSWMTEETHTVHVAKGNFKMAILRYWFEGLAATTCSPNASKSQKMPQRRCLQGPPRTPKICKLGSQDLQNHQRGSTCMPNASRRQKRLSGYLSRDPPWTPRITILAPRCLPMAVYICKSTRTCRRLAHGAHFASLERPLKG